MGNKYKSCSASKSWPVDGILLSHAKSPLGYGEEVCTKNKSVYLFGHGKWVGYLQLKYLPNKSSAFVSLLFTLFYEITLKSYAKQKCIQPKILKHWNSNSTEKLKHSKPKSIKKI